MPITVSFKEEASPPIQIIYSHRPYKQGLNQKAYRGFLGGVCLALKNGKTQDHARIACENF